MAQYPYDDLDNIQTLKSYLGSFWSQQFVAQDELDAFLHARAIAAKEVGYAVEDASNCLSRLTAPIFKRYKYLKIEFTVADATLYEGAFTTGRAPRDGLSYPIDENIVSLNILAKTPWDSDCLINGADFLFEPGQVTFVKDPSEGKDTFSLWGQNVEYDADYVYEHAGYLVNIKDASSERYKSIVNAVADASINGPSYESVLSLLSAWADTPRFTEDGEQIQDIFEDTYHKLVITDKSVYKCDKRETVTHAKYTAMKKGDWVTNTVKVLSPGYKTLPSTLTQVVVSGSNIHPVITGRLCFNNEDAPLTVTTNVNGYTKITWPMSDLDNTGATTAFFNEMHTRGVAAGKTLANYLDKRPQPQLTQPTASNLPTTINPADLLLNHILRNAFYVVVIEDTTNATELLELDDLEVLKKLLPPEVGYLSVGIQKSSVGLEIYFCTPPDCESYVEWNYSYFTLKSSTAITDNLILVPFGGGVCGQNTIKNVFLAGLIFHDPYDVGAGETVLIKPQAGLTSGAGGSIIVQPGAGVGDSDGVSVIKAAAVSTTSDLLQFRDSSNNLLGEVLNGGSFVQKTASATLSADTDTLTLTFNHVQKITCDGDYYLGGINFSVAHVDGMYMTLFNSGSGLITLKHNNTSTSSANRFYINKEIFDPIPDLTILPNDYVFLIYDATDNGLGSAGWRVG